MMKRIGKLTLATIVAAVMLGIPLGAFADDQPATPAPAPATPAVPAPKPKGANFRGMLGAVDKTNKTIEVDNKNGEKRTFAITENTKIKRDKKPATLDDAMVGDSVSGSYTKSDDGKMMAKTVNLTAAAPAAPAAK